MLPFYKNKNSFDATRLSLIFLFKNGANINKIFNNVGNKFVQHETVFNMIAQNNNMGPITKVHLLIDYKFDFMRLSNIYDNIKYQNGLILLSTHFNSHSCIKLLTDHCKTLGKSCIDIKHCDITGENVLFYAARNDIESLSY